MLALKKLTGTPTLYSHDTRLMGNNFIFSVVADNHAWANERINAAIAEITRIEKMLSAFTEDSQLNLINSNAGIAPVKVNPEIFGLVQRAIQISELTYGVFDIAYPAISELDKNSKAAKSKDKYDYTNIELDALKQTVFLTNSDMRIGFGALSIGYAADRARYILQMEGISSGVINAGGDLVTWGLQPDNTPWTIGSADPSKAGLPYADTVISNMAVATSFNNGVKTAALPAGQLANISHENGFEVSKIKSVSIITPTAELADAMASPIITMGVNTGLYLINKLNQIAAIITDDQARFYTSNSIGLLG
ncbi:FAD:protein FMN transferase [Mucilaginibacter pallidiroseus]|uniref:FAD:protein FMN transferase n=1 Tax=Mucilaginibacter pallidiroseus TaxID=2599295 RepID=A0A563UE77_9SPHI|nr:FAD:protein FMN transferase [Mucilaginibacter pallidiroseus]TWR29661.1 FAD:protein FMN transferase [Mucilaginibacter pallidiroseus]